MFQMFHALWVLFNFWIPFIQIGPFFHFSNSLYSFSCYSYCFLYFFMPFFHFSLLTCLLVILSVKTTFSFFYDFLCSSSSLFKVKPAIQFSSQPLMKQCNQSTLYFCIIFIPFPLFQIVILVSTCSCPFMLKSKNSTSSHALLVSFTVLLFQLLILLELLHHTNWSQQFNWVSVYQQILKYSTSFIHYWYHST